MARSEPTRSAVTTVNPGVLIGAGFGLVFLLANSGAPLPTPVGAAIKGAGFIAALAVLWAQTWKRGTGRGDSATHRPDLGRAFRLVVATEVVIGVAGLAGLRLGGAPWQANVAWIAAVVGAHFVALAVVWREAGIAVVGAVMTTVGFLGLALAATRTVVVWVPSISGVSSGFTLVTGSLAASIAPRVMTARAANRSTTHPKASTDQPLVPLARRRTGVKNGGGTARDVVPSWCGRGRGSA